MAPAEQLSPAITLAQLAIRIARLPAACCLLPATIDLCACLFIAYVPVCLFAYVIRDGSVASAVTITHVLVTNGTSLHVNMVAANGAYLPASGCDGHWSRATSMQGSRHQRVCSWVAICSTRR